MHARQLLPLLYASILGVLVILAVVVGYTLSQEEEFLSPVAEEVVNPPVPVERSEAYIAGKVIWRAQACGSCHNKNMKTDMTAPALGGVTERWAAYPRTDLYAWIRSSQKLLDEGHPRALELWAEWKPAVMANYQLSDKEIEALLSYIEEQHTTP